MGAGAGLAAGMRVLNLASDLVPRAALGSLGIEVMTSVRELPTRLGVADPPERGAATGARSAQ